MTSVGKSSSEPRRSVDRSNEPASTAKSGPASGADKPASPVDPKKPQAPGPGQDSYKPASPGPSQPFQQTAVCQNQPGASIFAPPQNRSFLNFNVLGLNPTGAKTPQTDAPKPNPALRFGPGGFMLQTTLQTGAQTQTRSVQLGSKGLTASNSVQTGDQKTTDSATLNSKGLTLSTTTEAGQDKTTNSTTIGPKGVGVSSTTGTGDNSTTNSATVGPKGVGLSTSSTQDGVTTGGAIQVSPDGISATVNGALQVSKDIKVGFEASVSASKTQTAVSKDGFTTATMEGTVSTKIGASAEAGVVGASGSVEVGSKTSYQTRMSDADYAAVQAGTKPAPSPYDPSTMPVGSSIQMKSTDFQGTEFEGTYRNIKLQTKVEESQSASILVEKTNDHTVRVTTGPSQAVENSFTIGVGIGPANIHLGKDRSLDTSQMRTAEFDLSTPAGKDAYNKFMATGQMPEKNDPGISNAATIQKLAYNDKLTVGLDLGPLKAEATGDYKSDLTMTQFADGTKRVDRTVDYGDKYDIQFHRSFGVDGKPDLGKDQYQLTYRPDPSEAPNAQILVQAFTGDEAKAKEVAGQLNSGQKVAITVNMTYDQMQSNLQQLAELRLRQQVTDNGNGQPIGVVREGSPLMLLVNKEGTMPGDREQQLTQIGTDLVKAGHDDAARQAVLSRLNGLLIGPESALEVLMRADRTPVPLAEDLLYLRQFQRPVGGTVDIKVG
jgi:hypothetical protein